MPGNATGYSDYVVTFPTCPEGMPAALTSGYYVTQLRDEASSTDAQLLLGTTRIPGHPGPALLYDLMLRRELPDMGCLANGGWETTIDDLHTRQRTIFENSITDVCRELFE